jgi:hypothetical protein
MYSFRSATVCGVLCYGASDTLLSICVLNQRVGFGVGVVVTCIDTATHDKTQNGSQDLKYLFPKYYNYYMYKELWGDI